MIKMRIKGKLYTGKTVYDCLCQAIKQPIDINAKLITITKKMESKHEGNGSNR